MRTSDPTDQKGAPTRHSRTGTAGSTPARRSTEGIDMALVDDIEFYGRAVDAGEMDRSTAVRLLTEASSGGLTELGAAESLDNWTTRRREYERIHFDTHDALRALNNKHKERQ